MIAIYPPEKVLTMRDLSPANVFWRDVTGKVVIRGDDGTVFTIVGVVAQRLIPGPNPRVDDDEVHSEEDNVLLMKLGGVEDIKKKLDQINPKTKCMFQGHATERTDIKLPVLSDEFKMEELVVVQAVDGVSEENKEKIINYLYGDM